jgi:hypothetical protein
MSDQPEVIQPRTELITLNGQQVEATWFHFFVQGCGNIKVLAADLEVAKAIMRARFPDTQFAGGIAKRKPAAGDIYTCQVDVVVYGDKANLKDIAEAKRRGDINYEVRTK